MVKTGGSATTMDSEWESGISSVKVDLTGVLLIWIICGLDLSKEQSGRNFGHNLHAEEVNQRISSTPMCYPVPR